MCFSAALRASEPCSFWMSAYESDVSSERSVALPHRLISAISVKTREAASAEGVVRESSSRIAL